MTDHTRPARTAEEVSDAVECAIGLNVDCGGTEGVHRVRDAVLTAIRPELDALAALRAVARGYCPHCGRGDATPPVEAYEEQRARAQRAEDTVARVRALHGSWLRMTLEPGQVRRLLDDLTHTLDQPAPAAATQATHRPKVREALPRWPQLPQRSYPTSRPSGVT